MLAGRAQDIGGKPLLCTYSQDAAYEPVSIGDCGEQRAVTL